MKYRVLTFGVGRAFTLIELLIVVAIIAILAAIAVPNFLEAQTRAKVSRAKADIRAMVTATETYRIDNNNYMSDKNNPPLAWGITNTFDYRSILSYTGVKYDALFRLTSPVAYMSSLPRDNPFGVYQSYYTGRFHSGYWYRGPAVWKDVQQRKIAYYPESWHHDVAFSFDSSGPSKKIYDQKGYLIYDPTNGTMSYGGIWYIRGSSAYHSFQ
jgi:prepilin-type N-terminal cleavage/methylation domain-containing protein